MQNVLKITCQKCHKEFDAGSAFNPHFEKKKLENEKILKEFYDEFQKYEIEIVDGVDFKAAKYFDITTNNWKLDKLVPSVLEANKLCKTLNDLDS